MKQKNNMEAKNQSEKYIKAQQRVLEIKQFYKHSVVYLLVNLFFIGRRIYSDIRHEGVVEAFLSLDNYRFFFWWGIALCIHAFNVFGKENLFTKKWEERKINEYMNKNK
ncbi:2TM domain-containing protein [Tenacibaculum finnmarkense]|uniref:2TM domain-containing protein n=1 Tax=Tenacibaculum finnmarkense TaxID=2781243 RepID=UPI001E31F58D|nr:2TM domain-containing protein [Tenacibaculum finnmarkense]MCD8413247.1 2TM domain-containing protein [Tenacibaculum finnmarkense genomovar ulcerans]MCG8207912.1 2TM domain-containing protein [Tenacibaculum finnmarkense genomovar finnmarkense]MCG8724003.1 2TM domain-containing protein [Tenacibaculum finnmarkense]MCG8742322.1 2TM domain-containing protein [Tenacibaculum finnmarkense]MCG8765696.1 2TM domain-containing protein [Tenacibaculum finnmarkense]